MKHYRLVLTVTMAALMASGMAVAGEIYKWTDDDGDLHYADRPTGDASVELLDVVSNNTDNTVVLARLDTVRKARDTARQTASEAPPEMSKAEIQAEREQRHAQCQMYRDRLEGFLRSQRLYTQDDAGDRQYLGQDEVMAARSRVEEQIQEYCGS